MKFIRESRRKRYFEVPEDVELHENGVDVEDGIAEFDKKNFKEEKDCLDWFVKNEPDAKRKKKFHAEMKSTPVTDAEWVKIQALMTVPENFKKEDVRVYHPMLAHNFVDRDGERFPKGVIQRFANTIIDKSMLFGHSWGPPGEGRFFDAKLVPVGVDQAIKMAGPHPSESFRKQLNKIVELDGGLFFLNPSFYILSDDEDIVRKIDAGIIKDMSIGFRAKKEERKEGDVVLWIEYIDNDSCEALEGSFVFLGSQYGAQNRKSIELSGFRDDFRDEKTVETLGDKSREEKSKIEQIIIGGTMKIELKSIEMSKEIELNDESVQGVLNEVESKITAMVAESTEKIGKAEADIKKLQDEAKANESWVVAGKAFKDELVTDVIKYAGLLGLIDKAKIEDETNFHKTLDIERLKVMRDTYSAKWAEKNPPKSQTPEPEDKKKKVESNAGYQDNGGY